MKEESQKNSIPSLLKSHLSLISLTLSLLLFYRQELIWLMGTWYKKGYDSYGYIAVIAFILYCIHYGFKFGKSRGVILYIIIFTAVTGLFIKKMDLNILNSLFFISSVSLFLYYISEGIRENPSSLLLLFLSLPWIHHINIFFGYSLRRICTVFSAGLLKLYQLPVEVQGTMLFLGDLRLEVGQPCSGSKYLFFVAFFLIITGLFMKQKTVILLPFSIVISLLCNILRITSIAALRAFLGKEEGIVLHNIIGIFYFLLALLGVYFLCKITKKLKLSWLSS